MQYILYVEIVGFDQVVYIHENAHINQNLFRIVHTNFQIVQVVCIRKEASIPKMLHK